MTAHSSDTRERRADEDDGEDRSPPRRAAATVASADENGMLSLLVGGVLLALSVRSIARSDRRGRGLVQGIAGAALLAFGLRQRRASDAGTDIGDRSGDVSDEASAHREGAEVLEGEETNPRGTSGEPDVAEQTDAGNVEFTEEQDIEAGRKPGMDEDAAPSDPRTDEDAEVDLSEASMADEAGEATGPTSTQAEPAQTEGTEPERTPEADASSTGTDAETGDESDPDAETGDDPDPDADPGEATEEAESAEPEDVAEEVIEEEIDDEDREGVVTEGGATVHTDTNESDSVDIDVDDVTDPDDEMNTEPADSGEPSSSHLDEDPPDEEDES